MALGDFYPEAAWQRCTVHFYRNVFSTVPRTRMKEVSAMLKAIHAQEDRPAAQQKALAVADKLDTLRLHQAAQVVRSGAHETLSYMAFPREHWLRIRATTCWSESCARFGVARGSSGTFPTVRAH